MQGNVFKITNSFGRMKNVLGKNKVKEEKNVLGKDCVRNEDEK